MYCTYETNNIIEYQYVGYHLTKRKKDHLRTDVRTENNGLQPFVLCIEQYIGDLHCILRCYCSYRSILDLITNLFIVTCIETFPIYPLKYKNFRKSYRSSENAIILQTFSGDTLRIMQVQMSVLLILKFKDTYLEQ